MAKHLTYLSIPLSEEEDAKLTRVSKKLGMSRTDFTVQALKYALSKHKSENNEITAELGESTNF